MQKCWPLHPRLYSGETLERYVRRLAECYGVRCEHLCLRALGISIVDSQARRFKEPAPELLRRLFEGTGVPVGQLVPMTWQHVWDRLMDATREYAATPEGQAELEGISTQWFSLNS